LTGGNGGGAHAMATIDLAPIHPVTDVPSNTNPQVPYNISEQT